MGKIEKAIGTMKCFKIRFRFRDSSESCRIWEIQKKIYCEGYLIGDVGKKEEEQVQEDQWTL